MWTLLSGTWQNLWRNVVKSSITVLFRPVRICLFHHLNLIYKAGLKKDASGWFKLTSTEIITHLRLWWVNYDHTQITNSTCFVFVFKTETKFDNVLFLFFCLELSKILRRMCTKELQLSNHSFKTCHWLDGSLGLNWFCLFDFY